MESEIEGREQEAKKAGKERRDGRKEMEERRNHKKESEKQKAQVVDQNEMMT